MKQPAGPADFGDESRMNECRAVGAHTPPLSLLAGLTAAPLGHSVLRTALSQMAFPFPSGSPLHEMERGKGVRFT
jgi:hypothetical protein